MNPEDLKARLLAALGIRVGRDPDSFQLGASYEAFGAIMVDLAA